MNRVNPITTMNPSTLRLALLGLAAAFLLQPSALFAQGALTPPGAPAPLFKTLQQIEPRTPISSLPFNITNTGSYYLTTNLTGSPGVTNGITISSGDVTLDLMGFTLVGGTGDGIVVVGTRNNIAVRNGTVRGWSDDGVDATTAVNSQFERLRVSGNVTRGIRAGLGSTVSGCTAFQNGYDGIQCMSGSTISDCTAYGNGSVGFFTASGSTVSGCAAYQNGVEGIHTGSGSTVSDCTANGNVQIGIFAGGTVSGCTATDNGGTGISSFGSVSGCSASGNGGTGISAGGTISDCDADFNDGTGIVGYDGTAVSGCTASDNTAGGILVGRDSAVLDSVARQNGGIGIASGLKSTIKSCNVVDSGTIGISTGNGSVILDCNAAQNGSDGIFARALSTVRGCTANSNISHGIVITDDSRVADNHCVANGTSANGAAGIRVLGLRNVVEGNSLIQNQRGIWADTVGGRNLVIRNKARSNVLTAVGNRNYDIATGNRVAETLIQPDNGVALAGETGGIPSGTTDPWSNVSY